MGVSKQMMLEREDKERMAREFLARWGILEECEAHEVFYDISECDEFEVTKAIDQGLAQGDIVMPDGMNRKQLIRLMMEVIEESGDGCYICQDIFDKD